MSPRAAWRLQSLGFDQVYDYVAGMMDWLSFGLPTEGDNANLLRAGPVARKDVPTCGLDDRVGEVRKRVFDAGWNICAVINESNVLLGTLRLKSWDAPADAPASNAMREGPPTIRPSEPLEDIAQRLVDRSVGAIFVSDSFGTLIGYLTCDDALEELGKAGIHISSQSGE